MDRITFFQSVDQNKEYDSVITSLFDQFSSMYELCNWCNDIRVENVTETNAVKFNITSESDVTIENLYNYLWAKLSATGNIVELYGRIFEISLYKSSNNCITVCYISRDPFPMNVT